MARSGKTAFRVAVYGPAAEYAELVPSAADIECLFVKAGVDGATIEPAPAFVVLDLDFLGGDLERVLPTLNGLEVCRQIRAANPDARVIVMSGMIDDVIVEEAIAAGAADCLPKAKAASQLIPAVKRAWRQ